MVVKEVTDNLDLPRLFSSKWLVDSISMHELRGIGEIGGHMSQKFEP